MYADIPFWLSAVFMLGGLAALAWSSDFFVDGSAALAKALGISPFIIGMVIIGFGTSAPELCVSVMSGMSGHANLSLGNAYGSCVFNIAVILGVAAMILPLVVKPSASVVGGLGLAALSLFSWLLLRDGVCSRFEASALLVAFMTIMPLYCWYDQKTKKGEVACPADSGGRGITRARALVSVFKVVVGLGTLVASSHFLVWGSVDFAKFLGVSDLVVGLTIVAVGTSLPELASAIASARRGEHEFVLGNIIGSNLFNTLAVVGLATVIAPLVPGDDGASPAFSPYILSRDLPLMFLMSLTVMAFGVNWRHPTTNGRIGRWKAAAWLVVFATYTVVMFLQETGRL